MPLHRGYSKAVVSKNISTEMRSKPHMSQAQAVAIALNSARRSYRSRHPVGPFPKHLQTSAAYRAQRSSRNHAHGGYQIREIGSTGHPMSIEEYAWQVHDRLSRKHHFDELRADEAIKSWAQFVRAGHATARIASLTANDIAKYEKSENPVRAYVGSSTNWKIQYDARAKRAGIDTGRVPYKRLHEFQDAGVSPAKAIEILKQEGYGDANRASGTRRRGSYHNPYYYSVIVPYVQHGATEWHPTESTGPFSKLSRGAFRTRAEAVTWAKSHLRRHPYSIKKFERGD